MTTHIHQAGLAKTGPSISSIDKMILKIDADLGKEMITRRFATVEPVFGNLRAHKC
ncbi:MAG: hypothetical protein WCG35_10855 [Betaproteobacteria bacterium]